MRTWIRIPTIERRRIKGTTPVSPGLVVRCCCSRSCVVCHGLGNDNSSSAREQRVTTHMHADEVLHSTPALLRKIVGADQSSRAECLRPSETGFMSGERQRTAGGVLEGIEIALHASCYG